MNFYVTLKSVLGSVASWSIRLSPYIVPDGLTGAIKELHRRLVPYFNNGIPDCLMTDTNEMILDAMLRKELLTIPQVQLWGKVKLASDSEIVVISRYQGVPPDYDCIDLSALLQNIVKEIVDAGRSG